MKRGPVNELVAARKLSKVPLTENTVSKPLSKRSRKGYAKAPVSTLTKTGYIPIKKKQSSETGMADLLLLLDSAEVVFSGWQFFEACFYKNIFADT
jgi:hypothetical protein